VLNTIIGIDGSVQESRAIAGDPLLVPAAIAAVKQWKYKPYLLDGQPITMDTTVKVDFSEQQ
jgi:periplasmic protein TonB